MNESSAIRAPYRVTRADRFAFFRMMIPALIEGVVTQLFGMVDTQMLGNTAASAVNISAVAVSNAPLNFVVCVLVAFTIGETTAVAWYSGRGERQKVAAVARQSMLAVCAVTVAATAAAILFRGPIVRFAGAREELFAPAETYFTIVALGLPLQMMTASATAAMRGIGVTRIAMFYNLLSGGANVVLNAVLIYGRLGFPALGVAGAAVATTVSKGIAFLIAMSYMFFADSTVRLRFGGSWRFTRDGIGRVASVGLTTAGEQMILQGGNILAVRLVAGMDTASIAAFNICGTIEGIGWRPGGACQVASTTFTGRALGEGRPEKARARTMMVYRWALGITLCTTVFTILFRYPIARLFSPDEIVWRAAGATLIIDALSTFGVTTHQTLAGSLRAADDSRYPLIASLISLWVFRVLALLLFSRLGILTVTTGRLAVAMDQTVRGTIVALRFFTKKEWKIAPARREERGSV